MLAIAALLPIAIDPDRRKPALSLFIAANALSAARSNNRFHGGRHVQQK